MRPGSGRSAAAALLVPVLALALARPSSAQAVAAADSPEEGYAPPRAVLTAPRAHPDWPCLASLLQALLDDEEGATGRHRFHVGRVVAEPSSPEQAMVRVYWPERRAIVIVQLQPQCTQERRQWNSDALAWYRGKARIDLDTDVVPTVQDVAGSSFLVARPWVDAVIEECLRHGQVLSLRRSLRRPRAHAGAADAAD